MDRSRIIQANEHSINTIFNRDSGDNRAKKKGRLREDMQNKHCIKAKNWKRSKTQLDLVKLKWIHFIVSRYRLVASLTGNKCPNIVNSQTQWRRRQFYPSLSLFSVFSHGLRSPTITAVKTDIYTDYLTIIPQHQRLDEAAIQLQNCLSQLQYGLTINLISKEGSVFHYTLYQKLQANTITLMPISIPGNDDKNIHGVNIDCDQTFHQHTQDI